MALTVRYPNGQAVTYHQAIRLEHNHNHNVWHLYSDNGEENWVASIQTSSGAIVEAVEPSKVENPISGLTLETAAELLAQPGAIQSLTGWRSANHLADIKESLRRFHQQRKEWMK